MKENPNLDTGDAPQRPFSQGTALMHLCYLFPPVLVVSLSCVILAGEPPAVSAGSVPLLSYQTADLNLDTMVDFNDLLILAAEWLQSGDNLLADISPADGDGLVNLGDFVEFAKYWRHPQIPVPKDMILIPGGAFLMGDHYSDVYRHGRPIHAVKIDSFYMGKYEVTHQQYCAYLNSAKAQGLIEVRHGVAYALGRSEPYSNTNRASLYSQIRYDNGVFQVRTRDGYNMAEHPVVEVSWYGAVAYCNWRSQQEGYKQCYDLQSWDCDFDKHGYRLPTEAEWEYAARGGCYGPYYEFPWCDNSIDCSKANDRQGIEYFCNPLNLSSRPYTSPVGYYPANPYGLYDMAGGVWERCHDWYSSTYYRISPYNNPKGPDNGTSRVFRGGGWSCSPHGCRVAHRDHSNPAFRSSNGGFRVVLDIR